MRWPKSKALDGVLVFLIVAALFLFIYGNPFAHHYPKPGCQTLAQLVADHPVTAKFASVSEGGSRYIVWIGKSRGATVSGPPVWVFDERGVRVDGVGDSGDAFNPFVGRMFGLAFKAPPLTAAEATALVQTASAEATQPMPNGAAAFVK